MNSFFNQIYWVAKVIQSLYTEINTVHPNVIIPTLFPILPIFSPPFIHLLYCIISNSKSHIASIRSHLAYAFVKAFWIFPCTLSNAFFCFFVVASCWPFCGNTRPLSHQCLWSRFWRPIRAQPPFQDSYLAGLLFFFSPSISSNREETFFSFYKSSLRLPDFGYRKRTILGLILLFYFLFYFSFFTFIQTKLT